MEKTNETIMSKEESNRISILKVWLTIMVIFIHSYNTNVTFADDTIVFDTPIWLDTIKYIISWVLSSCAVPAFFFLSSFFLYRKPFIWKINIKKKAKSLLIPYFFLNSFWILFYFVFQHIPATSSFFSKPENIVANWRLVDWIAAYLGSPSKIYPVLYPLWFVRDLFVLNILSCCFDWLVKKLGHFSLATFLLLWLLLDSTHIFFLDIQALCFWGLGCYFANQRIPVSSVDKYKKIIFVIYSFLAVGTCLLRNTPGLTFSIICKSCLLVGVAFWFVYTTKIQGKIRRYVLYVSKYTFCIYLFHEMSLTILRKIFIKALPQTPFFELFAYFGIPFIVFTFCVVLSYLLEKTAPMLYMTISGGRNR